MAEPTPEKTHAVVVGIEAYGPDLSWKLDGPAHDAVRFMRYLTESGVPKQNIYAFLRPLPENRDALLSEADTLAGTLDEPVRSVLVDCLTRTLSALQSDLLILFWGGHGIITVEGERRLYTADATSMDRWNVDLDDLLAAMRTHKYSGLGRQALIVDACANYTGDLKVQLPSEQLPKGSGRPGCEQFALFAAAPGEYATNVTEEKAGILSRELMRMLDEDRAAGKPWPPDLPGISHRLADRFIALRRDKKTKQTPVTFQLRSYDGSECHLGEMGTGAGHAPATPVVEGTLQRLLRAFRQLPALEDRGVRSLLVRGLRPEIAEAVTITNSADADIEAILRACLSHDGLPELVEALMLFEAGSPYLREVRSSAKWLQGARQDVLGPHTLISTQYADLLAALRNIRTLEDRTRRDAVVDRLPADLRARIYRDDAPHSDMQSIWDACAQAGKTEALMEALGDECKADPAWEPLRDRVSELSAFVLRTQPDFARYAILVEAIQSVQQREEALMRWLQVVREMQSASINLGPSHQTERDLLLRLGDFPAFSDGASFPLFTFVDGVLGDLFEDERLVELRGELDAIAERRLVMKDGIRRLRQSVEAIRAAHNSSTRQNSGVSDGEPAILVAIEPDRSAGSAGASQRYGFRVYEWTPESGGGPGGVARLVSEHRESSPLDMLQDEVSAVVGERLRTFSMVHPQVEFLVPYALFGYPFDQMPVQLMADDEFGFPQDKIALGVYARVVVRSWERTQKSFIERYQQHCAAWRSRWSGWSRREIPASSVCWIKACDDVVLQLTAKDVEQSSGDKKTVCVGVTFAPVLDDSLKKLGPGLLAGGIPIALWLRDRLDNPDNLPTLLEGLMSQKDPRDLRDRVRDIRVLAASGSGHAQIGKCLTLFWDDPDRVPPEPVPIPTPLRS